MMLSIAGERFGKLVALSPVESRGGKWFWLFVCDCGEKVVRRASAVVENAKARVYPPNCGCARPRPKGFTHADRWRGRFRLRWETFGRLYSPREEELLAAGVERDLREAFGPLRNQTLAEVLGPGPIELDEAGSNVEPVALEIPDAWWDDTELEAWVRGDEGAKPLGRLGISKRGANRRPYGGRSETKA